MYQKLVIVGNLGRHPELRYTPQGSPVCNFSVAVNRRKDDSDSVCWFRVTAWGSLGERCNEYLAKGRQVLVEGELTSDTDGHPKIFVRNDGTAGASYEVRAHTVRFLAGRGADDETEVEGQGELPF